MSERDDGPALFLLVVGVTVILMAFVSVIAFAQKSEIRDLQRRVGQLEQQVQK